MKSEILRLLKECDGYLSGQQLCDHFQVSRTAVWKVIEQLKKEGYQIEAVRNKGYRLVGSPDVLSKAEIESLVQTKWAGRRVVYYEETDSTNIRAKDAGEKGGEHGTLFIAERQAAGKGRRGRAWESPAGTSIYMTLLLHPDFLPGKAPQLTLLMGVAVAEAIRQVTGLNAVIKWPNDIIFHGKKLCGILTEMSTEIGCINYVVIGVGINVNQETFPEEIKDKATSLRLETGGRLRRAELIAAVMERFEVYYETFLKTKDLSGVRERYNRLLVNRNQEVKVIEPGNEYEAYAIGINDTGELLVRTKDGERAIFAGEVSVRGVYGYV
ncbi:MAG: biotin--[acetyl-CoA-carboxylase] ligase [Dorea sp.]|jgi:BirA family biotin operon repressor/biotin-[acetyl-CoA-carboxylase] ligase|nr:biotin--[acetyl-CoA-carboxylase] ligase [Dorea sp.]